MKKMKLWLLRHGKCAGGNILRGQVDVPLTNDGIQQMDSGFSKMGCLPNVVVSSSLQRCLGWSQTLAKEYGLNLKQSQSFTEIDFGDWDGQTFDQLYADFPQQMDAYWRAPWDKNHTAPNGEHFVDFQQRVLLELTRQLDQFCHQFLFEQDNQYPSDNLPSILIVTHGGVIKALLAHILGIGHGGGIFSQFNLPYGALLGIDVYVDDADKTNSNNGAALNQANTSCHDEDFDIENMLKGYQFCLNWPES